MLQTGVELVTGIPGAGKSYFLVERLLTWILRQQRPVYTNLPLKHRVIRRYLRIKGGEACAGLIHDLTEARANKFIDKFGQRQNFIANGLTEGVYSRSELIRRWEAMQDDLDDWWIPAGSVICIDEAHHWYPNPALKNVVKVEPPALMTYLTMHRHGQYLCIFATQAERQLSTTIKSLCGTRYLVRRWDREPLFMGISMEFLGLPILRYELYQGEDDPEKTKPMDIFTRFPSLPMGQILFRLYDSFTHSGGKYEAQRAVNKERENAGLVEVMPKNNYTKKFLRWSWKWFFRFCFTFCIAIIFYRCGSGGDAASEQLKSPQFKIIGIGVDTAYLDTGDEISIGGMYKDVQLVFIRPDGSTYWSFNDATYSVNVGESFNASSGRFVQE